MDLTDEEMQVLETLKAHLDDETMGLSIALDDNDAALVQALETKGHLTIVSRKELPDSADMFYIKLGDAGR